MSNYGAFWIGVIVGVLIILFIIVLIIAALKPKISRIEKEFKRIEDD